MLEGAYNFRDLGGIPTAHGRRVRPGRLFRSDTLQALTPQDIQVLLHDIGLRGVVDLRLATEVAEQGRGPLAQVAQVRYINAPMQMAATEGIPAHEVMNHLYLGCLAPEVNLAGVVQHICAFADQPVVFHCAAGKDRTGVVAAIVLRLLGVSDTEILADYMRSAAAMPRMIERFRTWPLYRRHMESTPPEAYRVQAEPLLALLQRMDQDFGDATNWALRQGIRQEAIDQLTRACLES